MKEYFRLKKRRADLKKELDEWLGTRFRHHCAVKQIGCDCIGLVVGVLKNLDILPKSFQVPEYAPDWSLHKSQELLLKGAMKHLTVKKVKVDKVKDGDICLYWVGKNSGHAGIYCDNHLYHGLNMPGTREVARIPWKDCLRIYANYKEHILTHILRVVEE